MNNALKISVRCLIIALALNAAFTLAQTFVPQPEIPFQEPPWLRISCHNPSNNMMLKPRWTVIITSVKPSVRQINTKRWEIEFTE